MDSAETLGNGVFVNLTCSHLTDCAMIVLKSMTMEDSEQYLLCLEKNISSIAPHGWGLLWLGGRNALTF